MKKGQKNKGLEGQEINKEFTYLKNLIDFNDKYISRLLDDNDLCRYANIRCYKDNYVKISSPHKEINASWIHFPFENSFISAQAPLLNTIDDFWTMCFDYNIKNIGKIKKEIFMIVPLFLWSLILILNILLNK